MTTTDRVVAVVATFWADRINADGLTVAPDSDLFESLEMDSLDVAELACEVENALDFRMSNEDLAKVRTPADLARLADELRPKVKGRAS